MCINKQSSKLWHNLARDKKKKYVRLRQETGH